MIYFTSDLHFWHKNSIVYTNRPFETVEKMNEKLIEYWNKTVHANDEVYILGDVTMVRPGRATEIISQLKGRKYLLMGNHDYFAREKQFEPAACGIEWVKMYHEPDVCFVPLSFPQLEQGQPWLIQLAWAPAQFAGI